LFETPEIAIEKFGEPPDSIGVGVLPPTESVALCAATAGRVCGSRGVVNPSLMTVISERYGFAGEASEVELFPTVPEGGARSDI
jgi:hypothetical protein